MGTMREKHGRNGKQKTTRYGRDIEEIIKEKIQQTKELET